ncbi:MULTISPECIES: hypothetical protein [Brucella]|uniref:Uncharacterized protein n=13 Tax=Brucella TaxID=234 RepID=Q2YIF0_BRUA2|nr:MULTISPECIES: hypothetical protein [Brucella]AAN33262.1 hypothetical protein BRA0050 [Brucella suis 1330]ABX63255.1 Hypothetical protein, conserved [Brucella canis ATCC 23365]ABY39082.1 Hypothetical protein, conserved [Brucella suis ATCC 23445]ACU49193.1 hypothetical protein BMI_II52 [Brucella microti CCM 4915]AEK55512.1 hypothetical protein BPI_II52 [Brucella pinnipedialis B2/94]
MDQELLRKVTWCVRARSKSRHAGLQMALLIQAPGPGIEYRVLSISAGLEMKSRHSQMSSAVATEGPPAQEIRHQGSFAAHVRS